jgi:hypothetical protein
VRLSPDGTLDTSFGADGMAAVSHEVWAYKLDGFLHGAFAIQNDDKVVVVGPDRSDRSP